MNMTFTYIYIYFLINLSRGNVYEYEYNFPTFSKRRDVSAFFHYLYVTIKQLNYYLLYFLYVHILYYYMCVCMLSIKTKKLRGVRGEIMAVVIPSSIRPGGWCALLMEL